MINNLYTNFLEQFSNENAIKEIIEISYDSFKCWNPDLGLFSIKGGCRTNGPLA